MKAIQSINDRDAKEYNKLFLDQPTYIDLKKKSLNLDKEDSDKHRLDLFLEIEFLKYKAHNLERMSELYHDEEVPIDMSESNWKNCTLIDIAFEERTIDIDEYVKFPFKDYQGLILAKEKGSGNYILYTFSNVIEVDQKLYGIAFENYATSSEVKPKEFQAFAMREFEDENSIYRTNMEDFSGKEIEGVAATDVSSAHDPSEDPPTLYNSINVERNEIHYKGDLWEEKVLLVWKEEKNEATGEILNVELGYSTPDLPYQSVDDLYLLGDNYYLAIVSTIDTPVILHFTADEQHIKGTMTNHNAKSRIDFDLKKVTMEKSRY